jgi:hypothetical protein
MLSRIDAILKRVVTVPFPSAWLVALGLTTAILGSVGCASRNSPPPPTIRRIAVLPPSDAAGGPLGQMRRGPDSYGAPWQSLSALLVGEATQQLGRYGFDVVDSAVVASTTQGRVPSNPETAAEIVRSAGLDATALFIRVRRWEFPYPTMRTSEILVSLDAMLVDPTSRQVVWEVHRPTKPVPLHGALIAGQAHAVAAQEVMREVLAPLGERTAR